jgi:hypothetical protein
LEDLVPTVSSAGVQPSLVEKEEKSAWLAVAAVLGLLGAVLGAACAFFVGMLINFGDLPSERLNYVINVVALGCLVCLVASIVCVAHMAHPWCARLTLAVNLSTSLYLCAGVYAILLEQADAYGFNRTIPLLLILLPLVMCVVAAAAAGHVVLGRGRRKKWGNVLLPVLVALAVALIPFQAVLAGDSGDAPEAAVRRNLGSGTGVTCSAREQGSFYCAIRSDVAGGDGKVYCLLRLGSGGDIVTSQSPWSFGERFCRSLTR